MTTVKPETLGENSQLSVFGQTVIVEKDANGLFVRYEKRRISLSKFYKFTCSDGLYRDGGKCPDCSRIFQSAEGISQHTKHHHKK